MILKYNKKTFEIGLVIRHGFAILPVIITRKGIVYPERSDSFNKNSLLLKMYTDYINMMPSETSVSTNGAKMKEIVSIDNEEEFQVELLMHLLRKSSGEVKELLEGIMKEWSKQNSELAKKINEKMEKILTEAL